MTDAPLRRDRAARDRAGRDAAARPSMRTPAPAAPAAVKERTFLSYLGTALSAALLMLVIAIAVLTILLPAVVGGRALTVLTQSMEPGLPPGTLLVIRPTPPEDVRVGDVLTYQLESGKPDVVSHRVIARTLAVDGSVTFTTQGDANAAPDAAPVRAVQVVGTLWYSIPFIGWVNNVINGDLRAMIVPFAVVALFAYAAWQVFSGLRDRRRRRQAERDAAAALSPEAAAPADPPAA